MREAADQYPRLSDEEDRQYEAALKRWEARKVRRVLRKQYQRLHKAMERLAESDNICKLLMTAPGVGPMVALSFRAGVDEPARFSRSRFRSSPLRIDALALSIRRDRPGSGHFEVRRCRDPMGAGRSCRDPAANLEA